MLTFAYIRFKSRLLPLAFFLFMANGIRAQSWVAQNAPTPHPVIAIDAVDEQAVWACGWEGSFLRTTDGGQNWAFDKIPGTESIDLSSIVAIDAHTAYVSGAHYQTSDTRIYKTTDGGQSWDMQYRNTQPGAYINSIAFWDESNGIAVSDAVDGSFLILVTSNGGENWMPVPAENIPPPLPAEYAGYADGSGTCLAVYEGGYAWFGTAYGAASNDPIRVFRSADWGQSWTAVETPVANSPQINGIVSVAFRDSLHGFAGGDSFFIQTSDGGASWTEVGSFVTPDPLIAMVEIVPETNGQVMVTSGAGSAYSTDGGASWNHLGAEDLFGLSFVNPTTGWAAAGWQQGQGGLISRFEGNLLTSVGGAIRESALLSGNSPNPFRRSTVISFWLPGARRVSLKVFDAAGKEVAALADAQMQAGRHEMVFEGVGLPAGAYFYRLRAGEEVEVGKMVLAR
ncbi:MAG: T9SS type A sorting domain-containing protein [Phaeodactylibacter sp.]|nr:T9SS type A sorting domain-containing protein [Phaeodactylibacter sp.]